MKITNFATIDKVISKVARDFGLSDTDWVDKAPDWCVEGLDSINCLIKEKDSYVWKKVDGDIVQLPDDYYELCNVIIHNRLPVKAYKFNANGLVIDWNDLCVDEVIIEYNKIITIQNDNFDCPLPIMLNKANIIDALSWYCLYCHMKGGRVHPVYSLASASVHLNPLLMWNSLKDSARATMAYESSKGINYNSDCFYKYTFDPNPSRR